MLVFGKEAQRKCYSSPFFPLYPREGRLSCAGLNETWAPFRGHYPSAFSLCEGQTHKALTTSLSMGRIGSLSPSALFLHWSLCNLGPHLWEWESPAQTVPHHSSLPWLELPFPGLLLLCNKGITFHQVWTQQNVIIFQANSNVILLTNIFWSAGEKNF